MRRYSQKLLVWKFLSLSGAFAQHYLGKDSIFRNYHMTLQMCARKTRPSIGPRLLGNLGSCTFLMEKEGPRQGLFSNFQWLAFLLPNEKESSMSQLTPFQFLLSG
ncbi:hypothetical protein PSYJA_01244 [Pseudomonas syringae pv. japonica str. M301072]|uniref:Secreted protein n=1 Tax=Pseudomonas syringae pv. japonica str. M301072 TaxID=629262 RepID=F3FBY0_PSESX|nr:hypothetical protein PSYJA_01244 [Pseudomonas syringae pv. japonica str. M301072]